MIGGRDMQQCSPSVLNAKDVNCHAFGLISHIESHQFVSGRRRRTNITKQCTRRKPSPPVQSPPVLSPPFLPTRHHARLTIHLPSKTRDESWVRASKRRSVVRWKCSIIGAVRILSSAVARTAEASMQSRSNRFSMPEVGPHARRSGPGHACTHASRGFFTTRRRACR
jgi:hypothetical protein